MHIQPMKEPVRRRVFLSYSRQDQAIAGQLIESLEKVGQSVWSDRELRPGDDWQMETERALEEADAVIVVVSPASLQSKFVTEEWGTALAQSKRVIPVLTGGARASKLPSGLAQKYAVNLDVDFSKGVDQIIAAVMSLEHSNAPRLSTEMDTQPVVDQVVGIVLSRLGVDKQVNTVKSEVIDETLIFMITSYEADMEPIFEAVKAAAEAVGLRAERVKDVPGDYRITDKMLAGIRSARLLVADLTHERPNVYFELGYARGLGKSVVTILRSGTKAHFDVQDWTYIEYMDSRPLEGALVERFRYEVEHADGS